MTKLLERQLNDCGKFTLLEPWIMPLTQWYLVLPPENILRELQESLAVLSPELIPIHERLVTIRRQLVALDRKSVV